MLRFYIVRHGQTLFNLKDRVQGWCDSPLTKLGQDQAKALYYTLKDVPFSCVYTSISERAYDTALGIIGDRQIAIHIDKRLKEFNFGHFEGEMNATLMEGKIGNFFEVASNEGWTLEGGENEALVKERLVSFFDDITSKHHDETILITSHGLTIGTILKLLDFETYLAHLDKMKIGNCSVNVIEYENDKYHLVDINNVHYRDEGMKILENEKE